MRFIYYFSYKVLTILVISCIIFISSGRSQSNTFKIGVASKVITPDLGRWLQGAGIVKRVKKVHDDLEANCVYFSNKDTKILMISCDLVGLEPSYDASVRDAIGLAVGMSPHNIIVSCTHTHGGPSLVPTNYVIPLDTEYMKKLKRWLVEVSKEAVHSAVPGEIGWGSGEAQTSWNRRFTWADGSHTMHGDYTRPDFTGLEGPDDPQQITVFCKNKGGKLLAIMYNQTTHPTTFYGVGEWSSDFPGLARKLVRKELGKNIPILFLNGAQGDVESVYPFGPKLTRKERYETFGNVIFKEIMNQYKHVISFNDNPILKHVYQDLKVKVRLPTTIQLIKAHKVLAQVDTTNGLSHLGMDVILAYGAIELQEKFGNAPFDILPIHAIRLGKLAIVTEPDEIYCLFGLDIKRRSPSKITMVVGLTNGYHGYVPTIPGIMGKGYSGQPIYWTRLGAYAGYKIVETGSVLINKLWSSYENFTD